MRSQFGHFIPLSNEEISSIWDEAILTVDTNVLLDLYRWHNETREAMFSGFEEFDGRLWLSYQAGEEYFRNRPSVIAMAGSFRDIDKELDSLGKKLEETCNHLRSNRSIQKSSIEQLRSAIDGKLLEFREDIKKIKAEKEIFFHKDTILMRILEIFENNTGSKPTKENLNQLKVVAKQRIQDKIPPGYMDKDKDADSACGDYILWSQVLEYAKEQQKPIILVTSERKEDWWDIQNGVRISPRRELLEEAALIAGQRVLIYESENFIKNISQRRGESIKDEILQDIRFGSLNSRLFYKTPKNDLHKDVKNIVESAFSEFIESIIENDNTIQNLIAITNAYDFSCDSYDIESIGVLDLKEMTIPFNANILISGIQQEERMWHGTSITADVDGFVKYDGEDWVVSDDYSLNASVLTEDYSVNQDFPPEEDLPF